MLMRQYGQQPWRTRSREADRMVATRFRLVRCCYRKLAYPCHSTPTMGVARSGGGPGKSPHPPYPLLFSFGGGITWFAYLNSTSGTHGETHSSGKEMSSALFPVTSPSPGRKGLPGKDRNYHHHLLFHHHWSTNFSALVKALEISSLSVQIFRL